MVQSQTAQDLLDRNIPDSAAECVASVRRVAQSAHTDLRRFILGLRAESILQHDFFNELKFYVAEFEHQTGIGVNLSLPITQTTCKLTNIIEEQTLQILQEALTNVRKHAQASELHILIECNPSDFRMTLMDNGIGFEHSSDNHSAEIRGHFGLQMMAERARQLGGSLEIRSAVGHGTTLLLQIPLVSSPQFTQAEEVVYAAHLPRVLLADDSPLFLEGLRNLLMARGITVVGTAHNGIDVQHQAALLRPDVIVMDILMPECDGLEATRAIKLRCPEIKVVMLTTSEDRAHLLAALQAGASGFLLKGSDANTFCSSLIKLAEGETILAPQMISALMHAYSEPHEYENQQTLLSERQQEIMELVIQGLTYKEIGLHLHISEKTIKYHMGQILEQLQVSNRIEAVAWLRQQETV